MPPCGREPGLLRRGVSGSGARRGGAREPCVSSALRAARAPGCESVSVRRSMRGRAGSFLLAAARGRALTARNREGAAPCRARRPFCPTPVAAARTRTASSREPFRTARSWSSRAPFRDGPGWVSDPPRPAGARAWAECSVRAALTRSVPTFDPQVRPIQPSGCPGSPASRASSASSASASAWKSACPASSIISRTRGRIPRSPRRASSNAA